MIKRFFKFFFSIIALIVVFGVPIVAVHDALHPWGVAAKFLEQERKDFVAFAVGVSATGSTINQKSYALIPKGLHPPTILFVDQAENGHITTEKDPWMFWVMSGFFLYGLYVIKQLMNWISVRLMKPASRK
jgi:hypothetical protein